MSLMVIEIDFHMCDYSRVTVVIDWMREKVVREPTPLERATCPPEFTCYACGEHRRKDDLAGEVLKQRIKTLAKLHTWLYTEHELYTGVQR